ncbi:MAG: polyamine ABC transporter substrate-binding protein [Anaerolineae bacterium]
MKRLSTLLLVLMFALVACAEDPTPTPTEEVPAETTETVTDTSDPAEDTETEETPEAEATDDADAEAADDADAEAAEIATSWTCPEGFEGQTLNAYNWSTYIADDTIPNFEDLCGVTVEYSTYDSDESMLTRIRQGNPGFDIIVPSGDTVAVMAREDLLIELDRDAIPNFSNLSENLLGAPYDPDNTYSVPYQWGTVGIGYNTELIPDGITTWEQVFAYDGPVAWLDDRRAMFGVALSILGYDPNTENVDEIEEARQFLQDNGGNVVVIAADDGQELLVRGDVHITVEYSGDIFAIADECDCDTYAYVIPEEAANLWTDNLAVPTDAPNPELAMVFIDYVLDPQVAADISNYTAYASPNQAAIDQGLVDSAYLEDPGIYPDEDSASNLFVIEEPAEEVEQAYNDAWDELLIFVGTGQ